LFAGADILLPYLVIHHHRAHEDHQFGFTAAIIPGFEQQVQHRNPAEPGPFASLFNAVLLHEPTQHNDLPVARPHDTVGFANLAQRQWQRELLVAYRKLLQLIPYFTDYRVNVQDDVAVVGNLRSDIERYATEK